MTNGTSKQVTVFVCGKPKNKIWCSTAGCEQLVTSACTFQLLGKKAGQTCGRALCASCASVSSMCQPHTRLTQKRAAL